MPTAGNQIAKNYTTDKAALCLYFSDNKSIVTKIQIRDLDGSLRFRNQGVHFFICLSVFCGINCGDIVSDDEDKWYTS